METMWLVEGFLAFCWFLMILAVLQAASSMQDVKDAGRGAVLGYSLLGLIPLIAYLIRWHLQAWAP